MEKIRSIFYDEEVEKNDKEAGDQINDDEILYVMDRNIVKDIWAVPPNKIYAKIADFTGNNPWVINRFSSSTALIKACYRFINPRFYKICPSVEQAVKVLKNSIIQYKQEYKKQCSKWEIHVEANTVNTFIPKD